MSELLELLTVEQFGERTNLSRTTVFALIASGEVESVKIRRLRRIPTDEVRRYVQRLRAEQSRTGG